MIEFLGLGYSKYIHNFYNLQEFYINIFKKNY
jgi:hypothetical protein